MVINKNFKFYGKFNFMMIKFVNGISLKMNNECNQLGLALGQEGHQYVLSFPSSP
jgi:hypothetical protein